MTNGLILLVAKVITVPGTERTGMCLSEKYVFTWFFLQNYVAA